MDLTTRLFDNQVQTSKIPRDETSQPEEQFNVVCEVSIHTGSTRELRSQPHFKRRPVPTERFIKNYTYVKMVKQTSRRY